MRTTISHENFFYSCTLWNWTDEERFANFHFVVCQNYFFRFKTFMKQFPSRFIFFKTHVYNHFWIVISISKWNMRKIIKFHITASFEANVRFLTCDISNPQSMQFKIRLYHRIKRKCDVDEISLRKNK